VACDESNVVHASDIFFVPSECSIQCVFSSFYVQINDYVISNNISILRHK